MPSLRTRRFLRVKLDMVGRCQLRCVMCHFSHPEFRPSPVTMEGGLLEKVAAEIFPRANDVVLSSSAEPLLAPDLPRALELCKEHGVPSFHFSTNALRLSEEIVHKTIDVGMHALTISVDGGTKRTFESIRKPMKWETLLERFEMVQRVKRERRSELPAISVTSVLMCRTIREMPTLMRVLAERGVKYMNFVHMGVIGGLGVENESLVNEPELSNRVLAECRALAPKLGIEAVFPMPFPEGFGRRDVKQEAIVDAARSQDGAGNAIEGFSPEAVAEFLNHKNREFLLSVPDKKHHNRLCYFPWYYMHVNPDGTVFPCGCWYEFSTFGDFKTQSFREIWTGEAYSRLRRQHLRMELRDVCANCSVANMGRPDVLSSFSQRARIRRGLREAAAAAAAAKKLPAGPRFGVGAPAT